MVSAGVMLTQHGNEEIAFSRVRGCVQNLILVVKIVQNKVSNTG